MPLYYSNDDLLAMRDGFTFDDAARILGMTDSDVTPPDDLPEQDCPPDETTWELRVYSNRPVFNLARIVREIDPAYTMEIIEK